MQQLSARKDSRNRINAYADMIKQLLPEIEKLTYENQNLKKELALAKSNVEEIMLKLKQSQEAKDIMEKNSKIAQEKATNDQFLLTLELSKINGELQNLKEENQSLQGQIVTLKKEKSSCMEQLSATKRECSSLTQKLELQKQSKQTILKQIQDKDRYHHLEVDQLRKINSIIKQNFKIMENDYESLLKITEEETSFSFPTRQRQSKSRQRQPTKQTKQSKVPFHNRSSYNPQMQEQLMKIKQQVSQQIVRINSNRQQVVKGRVDRTLATIESILSQMSHRVDSSDSESSRDR